MTVRAEEGAGLAEAVPLAAQVRYPSVFAALFAPFGISAGYASVTLAYLLQSAGLPTATIGAVIALSIFPQTWKFLWAPVIDTLGRPKIWYGVGAASVGAAILASSMVPKTAGNVPILMTLVVLASVASTMVSMSSEIFMCNQTPSELRGRASGWSQAGNLGGTGIGGGIGLLLAENYSEGWISGAVLAAICFACWAGMLFLPPLAPREKRQSYGSELLGVFRDVWAVARSRLGYLALIIMLLPIGSGAMPWSAVSGEWGAGATLVASVNGVLGGVAAIIGALLAGFVCDRMDPKRAYCLFGIFVGLVTATMVLLPRSPEVFAGGVLAYQFFVGAAYTGYAAIILEAIGKKSPATNWNIMSALSNAPIAAMAMFDGWIHDRAGTDAMLLGELVLPVAAIVLFALFALATRPRAPAG